MLLLLLLVVSFVVGDVLWVLKAIKKWSATCFQWFENQTRVLGRKSQNYEFNQGQIKLKIFLFLLGKQNIKVSFDYFASLNFLQLLLRYKASFTFVKKFLGLHPSLSQVISYKTGLFWKILQGLEFQSTYL